MLRPNLRFALRILRPENRLADKSSAPSGVWEREECWRVGFPAPWIHFVSSESRVDQRTLTHIEALKVGQCERGGLATGMLNNRRTRSERRPSLQSRSSTCVSAESPHVIPGPFENRVSTCQHVQKRDLAWAVLLWRSDVTRRYQDSPLV